MKRFIRVSALILSTIMFMLCINIVPTQSYAATDNVEDNGVTISFADKANRTVYTADQQVWEQNGITVTNDKAASAANVGDYANPMRLYQYTNLTIEYPSMNRVVFHCPEPDYGKDRTEGLVAVLQTMSGLTYTQEGYVITVDLAESADILIIENLKSQVRIKEITVYTEPTGGNGGTTNPTNPTDPTDPSETTPTQPANPDTLTTAQEILEAAYALPADGKLEGTYTLTGKITSVDTVYSTLYGNISVTIAVEGLEIMPIKCRCLVSGAADVSNLKCGDVITVTGQIVKFYDTVEFAQGCVLDTCVPAEPSEGGANEGDSEGEIVSFGSCGDSLIWSLNSSGVLSISGSGAMYNYRGAATPWDAERQLIETVIIHEGVTNIGDSVFEACESLISVDMPNSVTSIGDGTFQCCYNLANLTIPENVSCIGQYAFSSCESLTSVTIPDSVTSIGEGAFSGCTSLTSIHIPNSVTRIDAYAFYGCSNLTGVNIPDGIEMIDGLVFSGCSSLTSITIPDTVTYIGADAFSGCSGLTSVTIGNGVTGIGEFAFQGCISLTDMSIPASVTNIDNYAFNGCASLIDISIPASVTNIGVFAFSDCTNLTGFYVDINNPNFCNDSRGVLFNKDQTELRQAPGGLSGSYAIPDSVTTIRLGAFSGCNNLTAVIYCGTESQWNSISIEPQNDPLTAATRYYHNWNPATCTTAKTCTVCDLTEGEALGHTGQWMELIAPSCIKNGLAARICSVCGTTESEHIPALGHQGEAVVTPPTCTEQGYTSTTCTVCGEVIITDYVPATGHGWSDWIAYQEPSCTAEGLQIRFCYCGAKETESIDKLSHVYFDGVCVSCKQPMGGYVDLTAHMKLSELILTEDLYINLNSFNLSGTIITNGYKIYGMDTGTSGYTCDYMGCFNCVDENGNAIVPERQYTANNGMRYLTIATENGYTFHRFYLGITNISLAPSVTGFGYKAEFYGDEMVQSEIESIGYNLWLTEDRVVSRTADFKNSLTLRLKNFDVANYGNVPVNACVTITLTDGTVITGAPHSHTLQQAVETVNSHYADFTASQLAAVSAMIEANPVMQTWQVENIYKKES